MTKMFQVAALKTLLQIVYKVTLIRVTWMSRQILQVQWLVNASITASILWATVLIRVQQPESQW